MSVNKTEEAFIKKGIDNNYKVRRFFPLKYKDFSKETGCITEGDAVCVGTLLTCKQPTSANGKPYILLRVHDRITGQIFKVYIFNQPYAYSSYQAMLGKMILVAGAMTFSYGAFNIMGPDIVTDEVSSHMCITPTYPRVGTAKPFFVRKQISEACLEAEDDTIPEETRKKFKLPNIAWSLYEMHHPSSMQALQMAESRLLIDDLFYFAACNEIASKNTKANSEILSNTSLCDEVKTNFGYPLTPDQASTFEKLSQKLQSGKRVHALVQGDVGCGKTIVAILLAAQAVSSGYQAIIMAPTKILAEQHYQKVLSLAPDYAKQTILIAGGKPKKKELADIKKGTYKFIVGTHGLLSDSVEYANVGIVVIDEEHKFGVEQRQKLETLSANMHCVSMSATPIPRTLATALYGNEIEVFSIKTMPAGRKPIKTLYDNGQHLLTYMQSALSRKEQVYIVCPAIELEEDKMPGVLSVKDMYEKYKPLLPNNTVAMLTGKMSAQETEQTIAAFKNHQVDVLISTTVVEVGVDVPNATLIIIQNAERFGLSSMHQLRGRVGRGDKASCCILVAEEPNERIEALCKTNDGFEIAIADLNLRKSGVLFSNKAFGSAQSGFNVITEEVMNNPDLYQLLRQEAENYSVPILNKHVLKMEQAHNPKRRNIFGEFLHAQQS